MKSALLYDPMKKNLAFMCQVVGILVASALAVPSPADAASKAPPAKSAKAKAAPAKTSKQSGSPYASHSSGGHGLAQEWEPSNELKPYKQNYILLYAVSSQPNNLPTSPNPLNQVLLPYALDNKDVKFQFSLKHVLADYQGGGAVWFAYTQLALWQFYDKTHSQPFRELNYEPELIYSLRPSDASILNFGVVHQSNGEANPRSRSWDRVYIKPGIEFSDGGGRRLIIQMRWWKRIPESLALDDNPDITDYLGYRDLELRYEQDGGWKFSVIARDRATQLDIAAPLASWLFLSSENSSEHNVDIHLQYFKGYGESLLDYNQAHANAGVGISFAF